MNKGQFISEYSWNYNNYTRELEIYAKINHIWKTIAELSITDRDFDTDFDSEYLDNLCKEVIDELGYKIEGIDD